MSKSKQRTRIWSFGIVLGTLGLALVAAPSEAQLATSSCPQTSTSTVWTGATLDANTTKSGTTFGSGVLSLTRNAEQFTRRQLTMSAIDVSLAARGDFNKDGWPDFVGGAESITNNLRIFQNFTWQNENCTTSACTAYAGAQPNWNDPTFTVDPKFTNVRSLNFAYKGHMGLTTGDFNGDGWDDIFVAYAPATTTTGGAVDDPITTLHAYMNTASNDASGNPQFGAAYDAQQGFSVNQVLGDITWSGTFLASVDYNGDGKLDVLVGSDKQNGSIRILLNNCPATLVNGLQKCSTAPLFTDGGYLKSDLNIGNTGFGTAQGGMPIFAYRDVDGDGLNDLIVGAPNCCAEVNQRLRLFKGCSGGTGCTAGLENTASQSIAFSGALTLISISDASKDGKFDLIVGTDGKNYDTANNGGTTYYYRNNGTATPFSGGVTSQLTYRGTSTGQVDDFDFGFVIDYDRDPNSTPDVLVANGNQTTGYFMVANRISSIFVNCGDAISGVIDLGSLSSTEMVVTAARVTPTFALNGGTMTFWMSNEEPPNWVQASLCAGSSTDYCVSFPKPVGRTVRWKAVLCTNTAGNVTPTLTAMSAKFDYTTAREHYRAGIVVNDGVSYVGAFVQPGERGKFYAINAGLSTVYWEAAAKLDALADSARKIYTAVPNLSVRLDFDTANATNPLLQNALATPDSTTTTNLINWVRSARFGVGSTTNPLSRLGAIENSTPAVLTAPARPSFYSFVTALDRSRIDTFITNNAGRLPLTLFGAKDGMIHALHTRPTDISNTINGKEAWAFIPPTVAAGMLSDMTATQAANTTLGGNNPRIAYYPDGSPTLADFHAGNGVFKTVAIVSEGNGGRSITTLDVTQTIDPVTQAVTGPVPMWSATPGDGEAGHAFSKPAVARVLINNAERTFVIAATGIDFADTLDQKGRVVSAYDITNGQLIWKFQTKCPVTSDITVYETDDTAEFGRPTLNGFADRVIFADKCGYVYKLAPGVDLAGAWYENPNFGTILANTTPNGKKQYALFSTKTTAGALGQDRPITGTLAARTDSSTRMVLFFGTGGLEQVSATAVNEFYAIYSDTGSIRSKLTGACTPGGCEKFYGGTIVTPEQVILTKTIDPPIGTGTCSTGSSTIQALKLDADTSNAFVTDFTLAVSSAVMGALYGDAGAIYFATLAGDVARIGTPRAANAGGDSQAGVTQGMGTGDYGTGTDQVGTTEPFTLLGWRVVL
ncbi:MAG TPA: hypothetical protein VFQ53_03855 [Kofleriaceae bacterium]|nr:hypothetical protein [Kofleriaceae bacterium]